MNNSNYMDSDDDDDDEENDDDTNHEKRRRQQKRQASLGSRHRYHGKHQQGTMPFLVPLMDLHRCGSSLAGTVTTLMPLIIQSPLSNLRT